MFAIVYSFRVKVGCESTFIDSWKNLTQLIKTHEGSYGSKLHKDETGLYIAYALWPDKSTWEHSGNRLPENAKPIRTRMRECCSEIKTIYQLDPILDLLNIE
ncbi:MAG TPA: antibiotic biosynthesis monooxygenase [Bacteroidia bacterium]|nr:antibiotic biosynthesis monooxygenase [Bacteroidia bacterium]HNT79640.1 antibiotic biosynthesis monooxygenase [Bacteroidia bacterium]